jgi:hypothetical protein
MATDGYAFYLSLYDTAEDWLASSGIPFGHPAAARAQLIEDAPALPPGSPQPCRKS